MKVIISGGGTGGHIYPAVTIAQKILQLQPDAEILFVGTQEGLESSIVPKLGYEIKYLKVEGFTRQIGIKLLKNIFTAIKSCFQAYNYIKKFRPDLVIGTGGYVCGPVVLIASLCGVKTCIQEQNAVAGITNKILSKFVDKVFLGYSEAAFNLGNAQKNIFTGNPIRASILKVNKADAYKFFNFSSERKTLLISGGSRGAKSINSAMLDVYKNIDKVKDLQIIHVTGTLDYESVMESIANLNLPKQQIKILPYLHEMDMALNIADLAISRAGAIAIAELTALGVASILIPYPYATANHQVLNAEAVVKAGAGVMILDADLEKGLLLDKIIELINNEKKLLNLAMKAKKLGNPNAAEEIALAALRIANK